MILENGEYAQGVVLPSGATLVPVRPSVKHRWDGSRWEFIGYSNEESMTQLRIERNQLLAQSDWMAVADRTMTQAQIDYRQALRDLPETANPQLDEQGNLTNVTWPTYE